MNAGVTVTVAVREAPPDVAVIVTVVDVATPDVVTGKTTVAWPDGTVTVAGTLAAAVLLLDNVTT